MSIGTTPPEQPGAEQPRIGVDEWVASAEGRRQRTLVGRFEDALERIPAAGKLVLFALPFAIFPLVTDSDYLTQVGVDTLIFVLLALGLNVAVGWVGLLDLGFVAFFGLGAYLYAAVASEYAGRHWEAQFAVPLIAVAVAATGFLVGLPSRRLVGDYLAIVTLFFGQIFYIIATQGYRISFLGLNKDLGFDRANWDLTGGPNGIANVDRLGVFGLEASSERAYFYIALTAVVLVFAALTLANRSRTGRAWRALNDDPLAALPTVAGSVW